MMLEQEALVHRSVLNKLVSSDAPGEDPDRPPQGRSAWWDEPR